MDKVVVLGKTGYVAEKFLVYLASRNIQAIGVSRSDINYSNKETLVEFLKSEKPSFLINAAGYTGKPNVDACEIHKSQCLLGNAVLPGVVRRACEMTSTAWGHISSGCIYTGKNEDGSGFKETDKPNFSFRTDNCSFYSGTKALGEEVLEDAECYIWRLRIPFNNESSPRNYIQKLINYGCLLEAENSISHLNEFVRACFECWEKRIPFGIYNVTNPGFVTTSEVVELMKEESKRRIIEELPNPFDKEYLFFNDEDDFMNKAAKTPRSNCVMDTTKLTHAGITLTPVKEAIKKSLQSWNIS